MDLDDIAGFTLKGLAKVNIILGKNGSGKSYLLKTLEQGLKGSGFENVRYISPERGGSLEYMPQIAHAMVTNPGYLSNERRKNQSESFRQQSAALFQRLELRVLRKIERDQVKTGYVPFTFDDTVAELQSLLDRVRLERDHDRAFTIVEGERGNRVAAGDLSSGESELITLGIEFLSFVYDCAPGGRNVFLVDEPDVHLHPDLQYRLAAFILKAIADHEMTLIIATHSTPLLAALAKCPETRLAFMKRNDKELIFKTVGAKERLILPMFGAHPLSNVFNEKPILLVEGEDDERVWQQAVRSSDGRISLYPCAVDGVGEMADFEASVNAIIESVYDDARGYSLRDRDAGPELIDDSGSVLRMRLACRAAENLMLSDDALRVAGMDWVTLQRRILDWINVNICHQYYAQMKRFADSGFDRKTGELKEIRNILIGLLTNKPWEVLVGQAIARLKLNDGEHGLDSLRDYLGEKVCVHLLDLPRDAAATVSPDLGAASN